MGATMLGPQEILGLFLIGYQGQHDLSTMQLWKLVKFESLALSEERVAGGRHGRILTLRGD